MPSIVRIADPRGSTPRPLSLIAVGVGGVVAGLLLVQVSLAAPRLDAETSSASGDDDRAPVVGAPEGEDERGVGGDDAEGSPADELAARSDGEDALEEPVPDEAQVEATETASDVPAADDETPAEPASADAPAQAADQPGSEAAGAGRTLTQGRVAYFQCPGDRCPRDHGLERDVFRALERVTGCMGGPGEGDVRVTVAGGVVTDVRFRERGARGLDIGVLDRCLSPPLRRVGGSSLPDGVVVSFRFDVR